MPAGTAVQEPRLLARSHASHVPPHADPQQTLSVQKPLAHDAPLAQLAPSTRRHTPPAHAYPLAQFADTVQDVRHAVPPALQT